MSSKEVISRSDEALLAQLGYKQEFKRAFTPFEVFGVSFSIIGLLPSIASVLLYALPNGGTSAMVWGWLVASFFILCVGMAMAELGSSAPTSGGLYYWTYALSPPRWRNVLCWIVGCVFTQTRSGILHRSPLLIGAVLSKSLLPRASVLVKRLPQPKHRPCIFESFFYSRSHPLKAKIYAIDSAIYIAVLFTHAIVSCLATATLARLQTFYVALNVFLCLAVIIALPVATPKEYKNTASYALGNFTSLDGWSNGFAFIMSFLAPLWTICSFDAAVHISEEASNAAIAVPWAIVGAIAISGILGTVINITLAFCMGTDVEYLLSSPIGQPMAQIFFNSFGEKGTLALWAFVVIAQYMMGSSMVLATSRQCFAFSRDGALPFSSILYRINSYTGTPVNTVWFSVVMAALFGTLTFAGAQATNAVFAVSIAALYVAYTIPIMARFMFKNEFKPGPFNLGVFSLPVGIIAVAFMAFMIVIFCFPTSPGANVTSMNYTVVVLGGVLLLSLVWYYFPVYGGVYWFTGPVPNVVGDFRENGSDAVSVDRKVMRETSVEKVV